MARPMTGKRSRTGFRQRAKDRVSTGSTGTMPELSPEDHEISFGLLGDTHVLRLRQTASRCAAADLCEANQTESDARSDK